MKPSLRTALSAISRSPNFSSHFPSSSLLSFSSNRFASFSAFQSTPTLLRKRNTRLPFFHSAPSVRIFSSLSSSMSEATESFSSSSFSFEKQFEGFRVQLEESGSIKERIRSVAMEMESAIRVLQYNILLVHQSLPVSEVLEKAKVQISTLKELFQRLAGIIQECPGQYYRYHGDWRGETQTVVSLLAFLHWLETGNLLSHSDAEEKLGLNPSEFGLDIEDYLIGLCFMSNEMPRYVVNQVIAGDFDSPRKVMKFLTDLHAAFRMLNLRNDFLRKKFDGMKYDLRRVEEVYYDVKIRGHAPGESKQENVANS